MFLKTPLVEERDETGKKKKKKTAYWPSGQVDGMGLKQDKGSF